MGVIVLVSLAFIRSSMKEYKDQLTLPANGRSHYPMQQCSISKTVPRRTFFFTEFSQPSFFPHSKHNCSPSRCSPIPLLMSSYKTIIARDQWGAL